MHFYTRHIGDFQLATRGLRQLEKGAYNDLLDHYYSNEQPLPFDEKELFRICGSCTPAERQSVIAVVRRFFYVAEDGYRNARCDEEIARYHAKSLKAKENGKRGGKAKAGRGLANARNSLEQNASEKVANAYLSNNQEPITNSKENTPLPPKGGGTGKSSAISLESAKQIAIPETLASGGFPDAWHEWLDFRWRIKKPLQEISLVKQLQILVPFGPVVAVKAIQTGIANSYQGLFPEKEVERGNSNQKPRGGRSFTDDVADLERWAARESGGFNPG